MRFHYHRPREIWENLKDLDLPRRTFSSDLSQVPTVQHFITEDEIDTAMTGGSSFEMCIRDSYKRVLQYDPLLKGAIRKNLLTERIDIVKSLGLSLIHI